MTSWGFFSLTCQFFKYKCLRHIYIISMLTIVSKLYIHVFNIFNLFSEKLKNNIYNMLFYKVLHESSRAWKIYSPKNISLKNNSKNNFPKKMHRYCNIHVPVYVELWTMYNNFFFFFFFLHFSKQTKMHLKTPPPHRHRHTHTLSDKQQTNQPKNSKTNN